MNRTWIQRFFHSCFIICVVAWTTSTEAQDVSKSDYFEKHIRPILIEHCYECHSVESKTSEGNLRLDSQPAMLRGGTRGNTIDLSQGFEKSIFWTAIQYEDSDLQMPPDGKLPAEAIEHLRQWLNDGAIDTRTADVGDAPAEANSSFDAKTHWAYLRPQKQTIQHEPEDFWSRDPIDRLVFHRMKSKALSPSPEADERTLVRRLYHDIIGLPPSLSDLESYIASSSSTKYEELVDRLLASPAFGERMARRWMDVVRYADTKGYVFQEEQRYKFAYKYRDWLIQAFNTDMPYDQFLKYQLAADSLDPNNEAGNQAAMGMLTLGRRFLNNKHDIADDRIDVVTRGTMAISVICARCHDHKYDPIDMMDYYSLHSAFLNSEEPQDEKAPLALIDSKEIQRAYILKRGNPHQRGDEFDRRFVKFVSLSKEYPMNRGSGRLDMAEAIVDPLNPLTARTIVNRVWGWVTNSAIVSTPSDFGVRCPPPLQQDVLDQLAVDFVSDGWSVKRLVKRIVMTSVYRQSSSENPTATAIDPLNDYWWRANRRRMDFESLRDSMLATTGQLDLQVGGDSVRILKAPYPARRTVYAYIDRLDLPGVFRAFDFANPDTHVPQRSTTTVPQQGLFLLNNEFLFHVSKQYADALSSRFVNDENNAQKLATHVLRSLYLREPTTQEIQLATAFLLNAEVGLPEEEHSAWQYGVGSWDGEPRKVTNFAPLPHFSEDQWKGGPTLPDPNLGWCSLTKNGGHPDTTKMKAAVRRWIAPQHGTITIAGMLKHLTDQGDGVELFIAHQTTNVSEVYHVHNSESKFELKDIEVRAGETVDFVVDSGPTVDHDSFEMNARIRYTQIAPSQPTAPTRIVSEESSSTSNPLAPSSETVASPDIAPLAPSSGPEANQDIAPLAPSSGRGAGGEGLESERSSTTSNKQYMPDRFNSARQFAGPLPLPMTNLQQLIQAVFASNEFAFVD